MIFLMQGFLLAVVGGLALTLFRYFFFSGSAFLIVWVWMKERWKKFRIQDKEVNFADVRRDIRWACTTIIVQVVLTLWITGEIRNGHTRVYSHISDYGWAYFFLTYPIIFAIWDGYFYLTHRLLHTRFLFKHVHYVHHMSRNPTPFTTITFHPIEALVQWPVFPLIVYFVPVHPIVLGSFLFFTFGANMMGHIGHEFYPRWIVTHPVLRWLTTSTYHNLHHTFPNTNFGLYFNFMDRTFKTEQPAYFKHFYATKDKALIN